MSHVKNLVKSVFPAIVDRRRRASAAATRAKYAGLAPAEVFSQIYDNADWGQDGTGPFCSGHGSRGSFAYQYARAVEGVLAERADIRVVLDVGCGDFQVARAIDFGDRDYLGMDCVPALIEYNNRVYGYGYTDSPTLVSFRCRDAIEEAWPHADLVLIRQVLQHLTNAQIARVLEKTKAYKYVLITEDVYVGPGMVPNVDVPCASPTTRWFDKSGVYIDLPPWSMGGSVVLEVEANESAAVRSTLIVNDV